MIDRETVLQTLGEVIDPELGQDVVTLNLIREIDIQESRVSIKMRLTSPFCPLASYLVRQVREHVAGIAGVEEVFVELVWD